MERDAKPHPATGPRAEVTWRVRRARPSDADAVERLLGDFAEEGGWPRKPIHSAERASFAARTRGSMRVWVAAESQRAPFAFAAAHEAHDLPEGPGAWLSDLYVAPQHRSGGVGRALVAAVARWSATRGGGWIMWHSDPQNEAARRFYAALGAEERPTHLLNTLKGRALRRLWAVRGETQEGSGNRGERRR